MTDELWQTTRVGWLLYGNCSCGYMMEYDRYGMDMKNGICGSHTYDRRKYFDLTTLLLTTMRCDLYFVVWLSSDGQWRILK